MAGANVVPVQLPIGQAETFKGFVDLIKMKAYVFYDDLGKDVREEEIPADMLAQCQEYRQKMIESVAETDDTLLDKFFMGEELTEEDKAVLAKSYCYDEFNNIIERDYLGFWNFLIEKYRTSNKRIKAAEHKCNLDVLAIKEYLEQYKQEAKDERDKLQMWWENHCKETLENLENAHEALKEEHVKQEYALKAWQAESVRQVTEKLTADYEWKLEEQKQHYQEALNQQKDYYENNK